MKGLAGDAGRGRGRVSSARQAWDGQTSAGGTRKSTKPDTEIKAWGAERGPRRPSLRSG